MSCNKLGCTSCDHLPIGVGVCEPQPKREQSALQERNQCDGCARGAPLRDGKYHDLTGFVGSYSGEVMSCTRQRYPLFTDAYDV